jgi:hypothetical protein
VNSHLGHGEARVEDAKLTGAAGVLGVAVGTVGAAVVAPFWWTLNTGSSSRQIALYMRAHRTDQLAGMVLMTLGVTLWLAFAAGLWDQLRRRLGRDGFLTISVLAGLVVTVALLLTGFTAGWVLTYRPASTADARLLYDLAFGTLAISGMPTALALTAYAALVFQTGVLPRSTAWLAIVAALAHIALLGSFFPRHGLYSLEGLTITVIPFTLFAWIAHTGVVLWRHGDHA